MTALIVHLKENGARVILREGNLIEEDPANEHIWPYVETFDEVANALSAMHVLDDDEVNRRLGPVHPNLVDSHGRPVRIPPMTPERALRQQRVDHRHPDGMPCPNNGNGERAAAGEDDRCIYDAGHPGECAGLPF